MEIRKILKVGTRMGGPSWDPLHRPWGYAGQAGGHLWVQSDPFDRKLAAAPTQFRFRAISDVARSERMTYR